MPHDSKKHQFTSKGRVTLGVAGDAFISVASGPSDIVPQTPVIPKQAVRLGVTLGFRRQGSAGAGGEREPRGRSRSLEVAVA